jgi:ankyrin repeat protein
MVVQALLETSEVDLNAKDHVGRTTLSWASAGGHDRVVRTLLATGKVDPDERSWWEVTPVEGDRFGTNCFSEVPSMIIPNYRGWP